jgi:hypothetical protein
MFTWRLFPCHLDVTLKSPKVHADIRPGPSPLARRLPVAAQIKWRIADNRAVHTPRFARDMIVAVLSLVFSILFIVYSRNTGHPFFTYWAPFFLAGGALVIGIPVYLAQRRKMTEPQSVPEYR